MFDFLQCDKKTLLRYGKSFFNGRREGKVRETEDAYTPDTLTSLTPKKTTKR